MIQKNEVSENGLVLYHGGMRNNTLRVDYCLTPKTKKGNKKKQKRHSLDLESCIVLKYLCNSKIRGILC